MIPERLRPEHREIFVRMIAWLDTVRWFAPDPAMEALDTDAVAWLHARLDEHTAALRPILDEHEHLSEPQMFFTRSMDEAYGLWESRWMAYDADGRRLKMPFYHRALQKAADMASEINARRYDLFDGMSVAHDFDLALRSSLERSPVWRLLRGKLWSDDVPALSTAVLHLDWSIAFDGDAAYPSPWAPLLRLWERGTWPLSLPEGDVLVYIPMLQGGRVIPRPERPEETEVPMRPVRSATAARVLPRLYELGYGVPPVSLEVPKPLSLYSTPRVVAGAGAVKTIHPFQSILRKSRRSDDDIEEVLAWWKEQES